VSILLGTILGRVHFKGVGPVSVASKAYALGVAQATRPQNLQRAIETTMYRP
jgi:hypothetical protein